MKKILGFTLTEAVVAMIVFAFLAVLSLPTVLENRTEKMVTKGYQKAFDTLQKTTESYKKETTGFFEPTQQNIAHYVKYFVKNTSVKALYAEAEPNSKSESYSALKFQDIDNVLAGAENPATVSPDILISKEPSFWVVTEDNVAYSIVTDPDAACDEKLNVNTLSNLDDTLKASCFAFVVDTNGLFNKPNSINDLQDLSQEERIPPVKDDRYYIFVAKDGITAGNPNKIFSSRVFASKSNL